MRCRHVGSIPVETERLLLRGLVPGDAEAVFRNWTGDAEAARRVIGTVCTTNLPSQKLLVRAGFRLLGDGVYESFDGERSFDSFVYGLEL